MVMGTSSHRTADVGAALPARSPPGYCSVPQSERPTGDGTGRRERWSSSPASVWNGVGLATPSMGREHSARCSSGGTPRRSSLSACGASLRAGCPSRVDSVVDRRRRAVLVVADVLPPPGTVPGRPGAGGEGTLLAFRREAPDGVATVSTQTAPVNHSLGPAMVSMEFSVSCTSFSWLCVAPNQELAERGTSLIVMDRASGLVTRLMCLRCSGDTSCGTRPRSGRRCRGRRPRR